MIEDIKHIHMNNEIQEVKESCETKNRCPEFSGTHRYIAAK